MARKVLVVDDNVSFLKQVGVLLGDRYDLFLAKSGTMGLKIGAQEKPDLILLDVEMPEMDGFETLVKFRGEPWFGSTPVIFLTGNQDDATRTKAVEAGAADIISKPAEKGPMLERIERCLAVSASGGQG
jgi:putative two-component system response regulator